MWASLYSTSKGANKNAHNYIEMCDYNLLIDQDFFVEHAWPRGNCMNAMLCIE